MNYIFLHMPNFVDTVKGTSDILPENGENY